MIMDRPLGMGWYRRMTATVPIRPGSFMKGPIVRIVVEEAEALVPLQNLRHHLPISGFEDVKRHHGPGKEDHGQGKERKGHFFHRPFYSSSSMTIRLRSVPMWDRIRKKRMTATAARPTTSPHQRPTGPAEVWNPSQTLTGMPNAPEAQKVHQHGGAGVPDPPQNAGGHHLESVEDLKDPGQGNEEGGQGHDLDFIRVDAGEESGKKRKRAAVIVMNPTPRRSPAPAARRAPGGSPLPTPCPTRTAVAWEIPRGTMKVREARLMATWWPAMALAPSHPMRIPMAPKAPNSRPN